MRYFSICKCMIAVDSDYSINNTFNNNINKFEVHDSSYYDIYIKHLFLNCPVKITDGVIFSNENWIVSKYPNGFLYNYLPYNIKATVNKKMNEWYIYVPSDFQDHYNDGCMRDLCLFYSDQVMIYPWLMKNKGLFLHGNGLIKNNKGIILLGESGSGKTTLTKMLISDGWSLLCDDRTIIIDNVMYSHWCHGSYNKIININSVFNNIFFLNQSNVSEINESKGTLEFINAVVGYFGVDESYMINKYNRILNKGVSPMNINFNLSGDIISKINNL